MLKNPRFNESVRLNGFEYAKIAAQNGMTEVVHALFFHPCFESHNWPTELKSALKIDEITGKAFADSPMTKLDALCNIFAEEKQLQEMMNLLLLYPVLQVGDVISYISSFSR